MGGAAKMTNIADMVHRFEQFGVGWCGSNTITFSFFGGEWMRMVCNSLPEPTNNITLSVVILDA